MTVQGRAAPVRRTPVGVLVVAAVIAVAGLAGLSGVGVYLSRDRTASSPGPQTVTISASTAAAAPADGADAQFLSMLADYGIADNGKDALRQRFMELGHHTCFLLLPPRPQSVDSTASNILSAQNQDVGAGNPWPKRFTQADADHFVKAAIGAYCPNASK
jgi:Protein of unknown function (DUF732)